MRPMRPRARVGLVSLGAGLFAAGVGAAVGLAAERAAMGRPILPRRAGAERSGENYTSLRGEPVPVSAGDGTVLHVEVDEVGDPEAGHPEAGHPEAGGPGTPGAGSAGHRAGGEPVTIVFCHGHAMTLDAWYYQRKALRGPHRLVLWDQRGHGRSGPGSPGSATIDQLGRDLAAVLDAVAPEGPLVLVGHSMGGMTIMSLAQDRPELFAERVLGVALLSTTASGLGRMDLGITLLGRFAPRLVPGTAALLARTPDLVDRGRRLGSDIEAVLVRRYSFASPVPPGLLHFTTDMIAATRFEVIADFLPSFSEHDRRAALAAMDGLEVLVLVGDHDMITPVPHSEEIVHILPGAEHVVVRDSGHLVMLEHPGVVTAHLEDLLTRALRAHDHRTPRRGTARPTSTVTPLRWRHRRDGAA